MHANSSLESMQNVFETYERISLWVGIIQQILVVRRTNDKRANQSLLDTDAK